MNAHRRAEAIRDRLLAEWPNLYIELEDDSVPVLRLYGARALFSEPLRRAEELSGQDAHLPVEVVLVEQVYCSKSVPVKMLRGLGEPSGATPKPFEEDGRGVWLMCNNEDGHMTHDWGGYEPLPKQGA